MDRRSFSLSSASCSVSLRLHRNQACVRFEGATLHVRLCLLRPGPAQALDAQCGVGLDVIVIDAENS